jgi:hypothetical protein
MTDPLTDAVRRLKKLQQDVERLQSAENEEGEPRLFFTAQEQAQVEIIVDVLDNDVSNVETATATDTQQDIRLQRVQDDDGFYNRVGYNVSSYDDADVILASRLRLQFQDQAAADETFSAVSRRSISGATYNSGGYTVSAYQ